MKKIVLFLLTMILFIGMSSCSSDHDVAVSGIRLDNTTLTLQKGDKSKLVATVSPENATNLGVGWKSSNPAVVSVDANGNINAIAAGTADIIATTAEGDFSAICVVMVNVNVSSIALSESAISIEKGTSVKLIAKVAPVDATDKNVVWKSSETNVAKVDEYGNVTAVNGGNVIITATSADGKIVATCSVTVIVSVQEVSLDKTDIALIKGQSTQLRVVLTPTDATKTDVVWSSSDDNVVLVDNGEIRAVGAGVATITVTTVDGGKTAVCSVKVDNSENIGYNPWGNGQQW